MSGTPPYVELHAHSAYSFLDGASLPDELITRAAELGHTALAITDHDSLAGAMELAVASRGSPVRAIFGAEVTVEDPAARDGGGQLWHLTLLVRDGHGWRNLCRLLTLAHAHTRDSPDRHAGQPSLPLERVLEHADGSGLPHGLCRVRDRAGADRPAIARCLRSGRVAGRAATNICAR